MAGSGPRHSPDDYSDTSLKDGLYMMCLFIYIYSVYGYEYMYVYIYIYIYIYICIRSRVPRTPPQWVGSPFSGLVGPS